MSARDELLDACKAQHDAIDILFAMLIAKTMHAERPFYPSQCGRPWAALQQGLKAITAAEANPSSCAGDYTEAHLDAAACMWEHVLQRMRRVKPGDKNPWDEYREAYGMAQLRARVIRHAPVLEEAYQAAVANGYGDPFDWEFVPKYMEDHVTRVLT